MWSYDNFHANPFLGQAELNLKSLHLGGGKLSCTLSLFVLRGRGKKEKGDFGEILVKVWMTQAASSNSGAVITPIGLSHLGPEAAQKGSGAKKASPQAALDMHKVLPNIVQTLTGTLYEEPCVIYIKVGNTENQT